MRSVFASILLAGLLLESGCSCNGNPGSMGDGSSDTDSGGGSVVCISGLTTLALSTANSTVMLDGSSAAPISFTATGTFADGHSQAIDPSQLAWTVTRTDATSAGTIAGGVLQPNSSSGGTVTVTATDGCVQGSTAVRFDLTVSIGTPSDPSAWNESPVSSGTLPVVVYPSDQTRFPRNIYRTLFQWRTGGYLQFRLTFTGPFSTVIIYTDGNNSLCAKKTPAAGCWEADETSWSYIAGSNAGQTVTWTVDALDTTTATPTVRRAAPITIGFSKQDVTGAVFYWSTTSAGVRRANIRDAVPEDYITGKPGTTYGNPTTDTVQCVACHTVSRDGKYMLAPVQSSASQSLWVMSVTPSPPPTPLLGESTPIDGTKGHGFATISPDDATVVAAWGGTLWSVDRVTGSVITPNLLLGTTYKGTHPDWSPDNSQLVFATASGDAPSGASLAVIPYQMTGWGKPTVIVPADGLSNLFPIFSPDGKWIAYSRGQGGHGDLKAQLFVASSAGSTPTMLTNANCVVSNQPPPTVTNPLPSVCQTENNQPTWAPPGDLYWVAFNSQRAYGVVSPSGTQQIWVAAVDPNKLGGSADPSYPAFRLQFQGLNEDNHRAFWTLDVRDTTPPPDMATTSPPTDMARQCIGTGLTCDPVLDTCCTSGDHCDTADNGQTYSCISPIS